MLCRKGLTGIRGEITVDSKPAEVTTSNQIYYWRHSQGVHLKQVTRTQLAMVQNKRPVWGRHLFDRSWFYRIVRRFRWRKLSWCVPIL